MLFGDEVVAPESVDELGAVDDARDRSRAGDGRQLIDSLSTDFDPAEYRDDYRDRVLALIEAKASGQEIAVAPATEEAPAPDLMAALEASLAAISATGPTERPSPSPRRPPPARQGRTPPAKPKPEARAGKAKS